MIVGILSLQGAIEEHEKLLITAAKKLNIELRTKRVILPKEIENIDGLIMPGGESTAMILIGSKNGMLDALRTKIKNGLPVFGTCAGAILLSNNVKRTENSESTKGAFPFLDIEILRNGYGRQADSFSTNLQINGNSEPFEGVFIRAPRINSIGEGVISYSSLRGDTVFFRQGNIMATTFHPELTNDTRIHEQFLKLIQKKLVN
ncbi:MAG: pyridoxal 5'-phosphate synthase glutaminase subunit PdxT [Candidatus Heimdallarchaeota archaeon]